jgi:DNA-binding SARP family transcriptional activator
VPVNELAETLWGSAPPPSAQVTVQNYVKRLRHALGHSGRGRISTQPRGYLIRIDAGELDVSRFETGLAGALAAARDGSWQTAADQARAALSLWRGEPLADVESEVLMLREAPRLAEMRLRAVETSIDADLHLGRHADVIAELRRLVAVHPLRERLHALLMLALYRDGQQAEAFAAYQHARRVLLDELGAEPGPELRRLQQQVLAADPVLAVHDAPPPTASAGTIVPRQLPGPVPHFVGRDKEIAVLTGLLNRAGNGQGAAVVISAIGGMAGVGKTALAVHWAHQIGDRFPDGQLYVNLRGYDPSGQAVPPAAAVRDLLDGLGVPAERVPAGLDARAALYRSVLAGRRALVLLDNARDTEQVRPLLPGSPGCLAVVTSRSQLTGLAAADGAHLLSLDVLADADAGQVLAARLGIRRAAAEPDAVTELIALCGRLPLALAVTAARAAANPRLPLAFLAAELRDARSRIDVLDAGDPAASVRAVFSWSTRQLSPAAARMFRLLGLHPGPDITAPAAASLAGAPAGRARQAIAELTRAHLLTEHAPGRYALHDLLRAYAADQALNTESADAQSEAISRMLDHYLHTAHPAALLCTPTRERVTLAPPRPGAAPERVAGRRQAQAWFEAEHRVLAAAVTVAERAGFHTHAWQMPWTMAHFLERQGRLQEQTAVQGIALRSATRLGSQAGQADAHRFLGSACARLGDYEQARRHLADALRLYRLVGDQAGQARIQHSLCWIASLQGRHSDALRHGEQALELARAAGNQAVQADALNGIGWSHAMLGDYRQARAICRRALPLYRRLDHITGQAACWDSVGYAEQHLGHLAQAIACYRNALDFYSEAGERFSKAETLTHLGDAHQAAGNQQEARDNWQRALQILDDMHHPGADQVRTKLGQAAEVTAAPGLSS